MADLAVFPAGPELEERCRQFALRAVDQSKKWFDNGLNLLPGAPNSQLFDVRFDFHYTRCIGSAGQCMASDETYRLEQLAIFMPPANPAHGLAAPGIPAQPSPAEVRVEQWRMTVNGRREMLRVEIRKSAKGELFSAKGRRTQFSGQITSETIVVNQGFGLGSCHGELRRDPATGKWQGVVKRADNSVHVALLRG